MESCAYQNFSIQSISPGLWRELWPINNSQSKKPYMFNLKTSNSSKCSFCKWLFTVCHLYTDIFSMYVAEMCQGVINASGWNSMLGKSILEFSLSLLPPHPPLHMLQRVSQPSGADFGGTQRQEEEAEITLHMQKSILLVQGHWLDFTL